MTIPTYLCTVPMMKNRTKVSTLRTCMSTLKTTNSEHESRRDTVGLVSIENPRQDRRSHVSMIH